ncbi:MAG: InlB B-repeat-containing protein [Clostridia bacterium]|nr:InlB B-repeat-containing protein [Clostridia bacterium]
MEKQENTKKKLRFYHTKKFRSLMGVALALILVGNEMIVRIPALFAGDGSQDAPDPGMEIAMLEQTSKPEAQLETQLGLEGMAAEATEEEAELLTEGGSAEEGAAEDGSAEEGAAAEKPAVESPAGDLLAKAIAADGMAYVRVNGEVYSSANLREKDLLGRVSGIAIAITYNEANEDTRATVEVVFATDKALGKGFMDAGDAMLQGYDETVEEIGEDGVREYQSAAWPLSLASFEAAKVGQAVSPMSGSGSFEVLGADVMPIASFYNWDDETLLYETPVEVGDYAVYEGETPQRDGFEFAGWDPDPADTPILSDTWFTAQFFMPVATLGGELLSGDLGGGDTYHSVKFVGHDGEQIAAQSVLHGAAAVVPQNPTRPDSGGVGYRFTGWQSAPVGITTGNITADVVFTAAYETLQRVTFTINYQFAGGVSDPDITLPPALIFQHLMNDVIDISEDSPALAGYRADIATVTYEGTITMNISRTVTYTKVTDLVPYTIRYYLERAGITGEPDIANAAHFDLQAAPIHTGSVPYGEVFIPADHSFPGYVRMDRPYSPLTEATTISEYYKRDEFTVMFDTGGDGASFHEPVTAKFGAPVALPTPARTGYTFTGWTSAETGSIPAGTAQINMPPANITLKAVWDANLVNVQVVYWFETANVLPFNQTPVITNQNHFSVVDIGSSAGSSVQIPGATATIQRLAGSDPVTGYTAPQDVVTTQAPGEADYQVKVGEHMGQWATTATVAGDGSTILNVYYKRIVFTYIFDRVNVFSGMSYMPDFHYPWIEPGNAATGMVPGDTGTYNPRYSFQFKFEEFIGGKWPSWGSTYWPETPHTTRTIIEWYPYMTANTVHPTRANLGYFRSNAITVASPALLPVAGQNNLNLADNEAIWGFYATSGQQNYGSFVSYFFEQLPGQNTVPGQYTYMSSGPETMPETPRTRDITLTHNGVNYIFNAGNLGQTSGHPHGGDMPYSHPYSADGPSFAADLVPLEGMDMDPTKTLVYTAGSIPDNNSQFRREVFLYHRMRYQLTFDTRVGAGQTVLPAPAKTVMFGESLINSVNDHRPAGWVKDVYSYTHSVSGISYTFKGWFWDPQYLREFDFQTETMPANSVTLFAKWEAQKFSVRFELPGGTVYHNIPQWEAGTTLGADFPAAPDVTGMQFFGWRVGTSAFTSDTPIIANTVAVAQLRPLQTPYKVRYVLNDGSDKDLWPSKTVHGKRFGDVITVPADENYVNIPGFAYVSVSASSLTLSQISAQNELIFYYEKLAEYQYQVRWYLEGTTTPVPGFPAPTTQGTPVFQPLVWARHDTNNRYFPTQTYQMQTLDANEITYIDFYYKAFDFHTFTENIYLVGSAGNGTIIHTRSGEARVGDTVTVEYPNTVHTSGSNKYIYNPDDSGTINSQVVTSGSGAIEVRRYFYQVYDVTFVPNNPAYGSLSGETVLSDVFHGTEVASLTRPTPVPASNYYFNQWTGPTATTVAAPMTFTAEFLEKKDLVIKAVSNTLTYNGASQSLAAEFTFTVDGLAAPGLTLSGFTVSGAAGTNAGTYPNTFANKEALKVTNAALEDVTHMYRAQFDDGSLVIGKKALEVKPKNASVLYTGLPQTSTALDAPGLITGHVAQASVQGGGTIPGGYTLTINSEIKVFAGETDVTANYEITQGTGTLTIKPLTGGPEDPKIALVITPDDYEAEYTGSEISIPAAHTGKVTHGGQPLANFPGVTVTYTMAGKGLVPGNYDITVNASSVQVTVGGVDVKANYEITLNTGDFTIKQPGGTGDKIALVITPHDYEALYTGGEINIPATHGATITHGGQPLADFPGVTVTYTMSGKGVVPGTYDITVDAASVQVTAGGVDVKSIYDITLNTGDLTIKPLTGGPEDPKIALVITPGDYEALYTGAEISIPATHTATVTHGGHPLANFPAVTVTYTMAGKGVAPGAYDITVDASSVQVTVGGVDMKANYTITLNTGDLTIKPLTGGPEDPKIALVITPDDYEALYTGAEISIPAAHTGKVTHGGQPIANFPAVTVIYTMAGKGMVPGTYDITVNASSVQVTVGGVDVKANYEITLNTGDLVIKQPDGTGDKIPLVITANDYEALYTGAEINIPATHTATVTHGGQPLADFPGVTVTYTMSGKGVVPGTYDITVDAASVQVTAGGVDVKSIYDITLNTGDLTIKPLTGGPEDPKIALVITPGDYEALYTGAEISIPATHTAMVTHGGQPITNFPAVTVTYTMAGKGTAPGTYAITVNATSVQVTVGGVDMKANYTITLNTGTLLIDGADYNVEHYHVDPSGTAAAAPFATDTLTGATGATVSGTPKTNIVGYTYDAAHPGTVTSGTVAKDGSLTLKLYYPVNRHNLTYLYANTPAGAPSLPTVQSTAYNTSQTVWQPSPDVITGYTFGGWTAEGIGVTSGNFNMPDNPVTFTGTWTGKPVVISFFNNHDDTDTSRYAPADSANTSKRYGETLGSFIAPTRHGYNLDGWYTARSGGTQYIPGTSVIDTEGPLELYARWSLKQIEVRFFLNFSATDTARYAVGETANTGKFYSDTLSTFADPVREKYTFAGWFSARTGGTEYVPGTSVIDTDGPLNLYAQWIYDYAIIRYATNNWDWGTASPGSEEVHKILGDAQGSTASANPGYIFVNWTDSQGQIVSTNRTFVPGRVGGVNVDATFTANFREMDHVTVRYVARAGGVVYPTLWQGNPQLGDPVRSTATPNAGFEFVNWTDASGNVVGTGISYRPRKEANQLWANGTTFYANFAPTGVLGVGDLIDIPVNKVWSGITGTPSLPSITVTLRRNGAVYRTLRLGNGNWSGVFANVPANGPNGQPYTYSVTEGAVPGFTLVGISGAAQEGFTITNAPSGMLNVYFLDWNGKLLKHQQVAYGASATPPEDPVRANYQFTGWGGDYTSITRTTYIRAQYGLSDGLDFMEIADLAIPLAGGSISNFGDMIE